MLRAPDTGAGRVHDASQRVAEDVGIVPVVEPPLQLFQVAVHMLDAHLVEGSDDGTLEEAPHAFDTVGVLHRPQPTPRRSG